MGSIVRNIIVADLLGLSLLSQLCWLPVNLFFVSKSGGIAVIYRGSILPRSFIFLYLIVYLIFEIHFIIMLSIGVLLALITLELRIVDEKLLFQLSIFKLCMIKKQLLPSNIEIMKFKRTGWAQKLVSITVKKGLNVRIADFHPVDVYENLLGYAIEYDVPIYKTKDYKILERMEKTREKI